MEELFKMKMDGSPVLIPLESLPGEPAEQLGDAISDFGGASSFMTPAPSEFGAAFAGVKEYNRWLQKNQRHAMTNLQKRLGQRNNQARWQSP